MTINLINSSINSSIAAIDFSKSLRSDIYLKPGELLDFNRYFSINEFSKIYLDNLGIWNQLDKEKYIAYTSIDVYLKEKKSIDFHSDNPHSQNLGYIVYEGDLLNAISKCISKCKSIRRYDNKISDNTSDINIHTKIDELEKNDIQFKFKNKNYDQTAMNITFEHTKSNSRKPRQIFYNNEILGLLPVNEYSYNLIWSMPKNFFDQVNKASSATLLEYLSDRVGFVLGDIKKTDIKYGKRENSWPRFPPTSCISLRKKSLDFVIRKIFFKDCPDLWIDFRLASFYAIKKNQFNLSSD